MEFFLIFFLGVTTFIFCVLYLFAAYAIHKKNKQREEVAELRNLFESAFDAVISMNAELEILDWNVQAEKTFGWKKEEVLGKKISDSVIPLINDSPILNRAIEMEGIKKNGEVFPIEISLNCINRNQNRFFTALITDISQRKKNESELIAARQSALDAAKAKSEFLANMSHEIRTPLNGIIGMTDLLLDTVLDEQQRKFAKIVQESGNGLLSIINDILDFSKVEAGKLHLELIDFDVVNIIESQSEILARWAQEKGLCLMTYIDPACPSSLRGDPGRIGQILLNLIGNAIKFTREGNILVRAVLIQENDTHARIKFSVEDTGIGLSAEAIQRLFQPFTQADGSTARKFGGTGLGLSICKRLIELMNGTISVESEEGNGSTFWFEIPLEKTENSLKISKALEASKTNELKVMIFDNDPEVCNILESYLRSWNIRTQSVSRAKEAFESMRKSYLLNDPFQVVLVDKKIPEMDGFEFAKDLKSRDYARNVKLILLTSFNGDLKGFSKMKNHFSSHLSKPIKQSSLYDAIVSAMHADTGGFIDRKRQLDFEKSFQASSLLHAKQKRILVAEDNSVNQMLTLAQLRKLGYAAHAVANGREVLEAIQNAAYDMILMDCQMPEMDGYEATKAIRVLEEKGISHIPIIALTANARKEDREKCIASGMDDYVSKPLKQEVLAEVILRWMGEISESEKAA